MREGSDEEGQEDHGAVQGVSDQIRSRSLSVSLPSIEKMGKLVSLVVAVYFFCLIVTEKSSDYFFKNIEQLYEGEDHIRHLTRLVAIDNISVCLTPLLFSVIHTINKKCNNCRSDLNDGDEQVLLAGVGHSSQLNDELAKLRLAFLMATFLCGAPLLLYFNAPLKPDDTGPLKAGATVSTTFNLGDRTLKSHYLRSDREDFSVWDKMGMQLIFTSNPTVSICNMIYKAAMLWGSLLVINTLSDVTFPIMMSTFKLEGKLRTSILNGFSRGLAMTSLLIVPLFFVYCSWTFGSPSTYTYLETLEPYFENIKGRFHGSHVEGDDALSQLSSIIHNNGINWDNSSLTFNLTVVKPVSVKGADCLPNFLIPMLKIPVKLQLHFGAKKFDLDLQSVYAGESCAPPLLSLWELFFLYPVGGVLSLAASCFGESKFTQWLDCVFNDIWKFITQKKQLLALIGIAAVLILFNPNLGAKKAADGALGLINLSWPHKKENFDRLINAFIEAWPLSMLVLGVVAWLSAVKNFRSLNNSPSGEYEKLNNSINSSVPQGDDLRDVGAPGDDGDITYAATSPS